MNGYDAIMRVERETPAFLSLVKACFDYEREPFKKMWVAPRVYGTLGRLVELDVLERVALGGVDRNAEYRFIDREGAGRALAEIG